METKSLVKLKSVLIWSLVALVVALSATFLAACGGTSADGTWRVDRIVVDNNVIKSTDTDKKGHESDFLNEIMLKTDKTGSIKLGDTEPVTLEWAQQNEAITLTYNESDEVYTLSGTELIYKKGTLQIYYKKSA